MIIVQICRPRIGGAVLPVLRGHRHGRRGESRSAALRFKEWAHFREERQGHRGGRNDFCRNSLSTVWKITWDLRLLEFAVQSLYNFHEQYSCESSLEENLMYWTSLNAQPSNVSFSMKPLKSIFFNLKKKSLWKCKLQLLKHRTEIESSLNYSSLCELPDRPEVTPSAKARQLLDDVLTNPEICPLARDDLTGRSDLKDMLISRTIKNYW